MQGKCKDISGNKLFKMMNKLVAPDHFLRKISATIDFSFVDKETESLFSPNRGRESLPPQQYFKMLLIKHLYGISSIRQLVEDIQYNIAYRWFCGFNLDEKIPDQSYFSKAKKRFDSKIFESFFNSILQNCVNQGLVQSNSIMTDSTLFNANASLNSLERRDNEKENKFSRKISNKTHISTTDPDSCLAFKTGTTRTLKYKAHVCTDSESRVITNIKITSGAIKDSALLIKQINQLNQLNINITEAIADKAYGTGELLTQLHEKMIETNIPLFNSRSGSSKRTDIPGFEFKESFNHYICPNNKVIAPCSKKDGKNTLYTSKASDCKKCQLSESCLAPLKNGGPTRLLSRNEYYELYEKVKIDMKKKEFKEKLYQRMCKIEGVMNELKNYHGLNRADYRGLESVSIQAYMAAIAINIKRIISFCVWKYLLNMCFYFSHENQQAGWVSERLLRAG